MYQGWEKNGPPDIPAPAPPASEAVKCAPETNAVPGVRTHYLMNAIESSTPSMQTPALLPFPLCRLHRDSHLLSLSWARSVADVGFCCWSMRHRRSASPTSTLQHGMDKPNLRESPNHGYTFAGCSSSSHKTTFSPAFHSILAPNAAIPSVTLRVKEISSGLDRINFANSLRVASTVSNSDDFSQGALSRQVKALEEHLGVVLFKRGPRGLAFTQEGELLYDYSRRAFDTLETGVRHLSVSATRETLIVSLARSFAVCFFCRRVSSFVRSNPWIDLRIDVHRYFVDLDSSGADISIRLGSGTWDGYRTLALSDDRVGLVCSPGLSQQYEKLGPTDVVKDGLLLRNVERDYWGQWQEAKNRMFDIDGSPTMRFNDSAPMLEAAKGDGGLCLTRLALVSDALADGTLTKLWGQELADGQRYYAVCASRTNSRRAVELFMNWLQLEFRSASENS